jgi:hypothetical protein
VCFGAIIMYSSYNKFDQDIYKWVLIYVREFLILNLIKSFFKSFKVFSQKKNKKLDS